MLFRSRGLPGSSELDERVQQLKCAGIGNKVTRSTDFCGTFYGIAAEARQPS
jgi:hypothetical protein